MIALFNKLLDWFKALFWKEEMELTLVGLQYSGKTTFVNVIAVRGAGRGAGRGPGGVLSPPARRSLGNRVAAWPGRAPRGGEAGSLGPSAARGDPRARDPVSCPAGVARLGRGTRRQGWYPGPAAPKGHEAGGILCPRRPAPSAPAQGGMTERKCRACQP